MSKDNRDDIKTKLVVLKNLVESDKRELTKEEIELKSKLLEIESKLDSIENTLKAISDERKNTLFSDHVFSTVIGTIAIAAATNLIAEYFGVKKEDIDDILF